MSKVVSIMEIGALVPVSDEKGLVNYADEKKIKLGVDRTNCIAIPVNGPRKKLQDEITI